MTKRYAPRKLWQTILLSIFNSTILAALVAGATWLTTKWPFTPLVVSGVLIAVKLLGGLAIAWMTYGRPYVKFNEVFNGGNLLAYSTVGLGLYFLEYLLIQTLYSTGHIALAVIFGVPLALFLLSFLTVAGQKYVYDLRATKPNYVEADLTFRKYVSSLLIKIPFLRKWVVRKEAIRDAKGENKKKRKAYRKASKLAKKEGTQPPKRPVFLSPKKEADKIWASYLAKQEEKMKEKSNRA